MPLFLLIRFLIANVCLNGLNNYKTPWRWAQPKARNIGIIKNWNDHSFLMVRNIGIIKSGNVHISFLMVQEIIILHENYIYTQNTTNVETNCKLLALQTTPNHKWKNFPTHHQWIHSRIPQAVQKFEANFKSFLILLCQ
jgi:hypothetical protein